MKDTLDPVESGSRRIRRETTKALRQALPKATPRLLLTNKPQPMPWADTALEPYGLPASATFKTFREVGYDQYEVVHVSRVVKAGQVEGYLPTVSPTLILAAGVKPFRTLYSAEVCFIDVDFDPAEDPDKQRGPLMRKIHRFVDANPEFGFRCYRTAAGLRHLLTSHTIMTRNNDLLPWAYSLGADPKYMRMCEAQNMFAARLDPKPERMTPGVQYAVTDYLWHEGNPVICRDAMVVLRHHDRETRAHAELPLA